MSAPVEDRVPTPRTFKELQTWIQRLNNQYARIQELEAARDEAAEPWNIALAPHKLHSEILVNGITHYVIEHEKSLKQHRGRTITFGPFVLKFSVGQQSVQSVSDPELTKTLIENGFEELVRYQPVPYKTKIKAKLQSKKHPTRAERSEATKLRKVLDAVGTYVSRHQTISLDMPALKEPIVLQRRRFPLARPFDSDMD